MIARLSPFASALITLFRGRLNFCIPLVRLQHIFFDFPLKGFAFVVTFGENVLVRAGTAFESVGDIGCVGFRGVAVSGCGNGEDVRARRTD